MHTPPIRPPAVAQLCVALLLWMGSAGASAQAVDSSSPTPAQRLAKLEQQFEAQDLDEDGVAQIQGRANAIRVEASACERRKQSEIDGLRANLGILRGPVEPDKLDDPEGDGTTATAADEVVDQRAEIEAQIRDLEIEISRCNLNELRAKNLADAALTRIRELSARRLMSHGTPILRLLRDDLRDLPNTVAVLAETALDVDQLAQVSKARWLIVLFTGMLAAGVGVLLQREVVGWSEKQRGRGGEPALQAVFARNVAPWLPMLLGGLTVSVALTLFLSAPASALVVTRLAYSIAALGLGGIFVDWLTGPYSPGAELLSEPASASMLRTRAHALGVALAIGYTAFGAAWLTEIPSAAALAPRALLTVFTGTALIWLVRSAARIPQMRGRLLLLRGLLLIAAITAVMADLSGYRNLSNHLLLATTGTLFGATLLWTGLWIVRSAAHGIVHGRGNVSYRVRGWLSMRPEEPSAELGWLRLILSLAMWLAFGALLILLWDSTGNAMPKLNDVVTQGIRFGDDDQIVPADILVGLSVFGLIIALTAWIKAQMNKRWLRDMGIARGSREALVTLGGYVGFVIAAFAGLTLAGVDFKGFAFVLGALSVGIGFGLQNVVNNFASGLILLFERPIKSGDFVSVGDVEGTVKDIRIRSTEIETLDRRNVIVPNSELVSTQVTNWVLHDSFGRLTLNIGVAYGSDTAKVKKILLDIANEHPDVLTKGPSPAPKVLFMGFGDSSLDFELRIWIRQIERRFDVQSDVNFAVDKAFRDAQIEIPFPQRDLHVRSWSAGATPELHDSSDILPHHADDTDARHDASARRPADQSDAD